uniref:histidine kinase n=1 Tax=Desulfatirhabdium butyrativorans TaxID=340467 RepID=A0A7C4MPA7_9BACT
MEQDVFRMMMETLDTPVYVTDVETNKVLYANAALKKRMPVDPVGQVCWKGFHPGSSGPCSFCSASKPLDPKRILENVSVWDRLDVREERWYRHINRVLAMPDGRLVRFDIAFDVHDKVQGEVKLREQMAFYDQLIENSPVAIVISGLDGNIVRINQEFTRLFGYTLEEVRGKNVSALLAPEGLEKEAHTLRSQIAEGQRIHVETKRKNKLGQSIDVAVTGSPLLSANRLVGIQAVYMDISSRKEAEMEKARLEIQLIQAQKMEALGVLAGGIAHDFNNILGAIMGFGQMALMDAQKGIPKPHDIAQILKSAERAKQLVKQILMFSRRVSPELRLIQLNDVIRQSLILLERTLPKNVIIEQNLQPDLGLIHADPTQIDQIIMNLGTNAADAMPNGGVLRYETRMEQVEENRQYNGLKMNPGSYVVLRVSDTGCGMDDKTVRHIFDPFFTTKGVGKGTGLGLSTVFGIVKGHSGYIQCISKPGKGTIFDLYFPAQSGREEVCDIIVEPVLVNENDHRTILVVDDDPFIREFCQEILDRLGYHVITCESGEEAVQIYRSKQEPIDLVILDLGMPGMGGYACLQQLLKIDPHVKVLIASGYGPIGHSERAIEAGAKGYIAKPYRMEELNKAIQKILR